MVSKGLKIKIGHKDAIRLNFSKFGVYLIMVPLAFVMILPLIYVIGSAFKPISELVKFPPVFFVRKPTLNNFSDLFLALDASSVPFSVVFALPPDFMVCTGPCSWDPT